MMLTITCIVAFIALVILYALVRPKNEVWESMTRWELGQRVIRVWREESEPCYGPDSELLLILRQFDEETRDSEILERIGNMPRISAVEILRDGHGIIRYPDWR
jgi:hypothetical protein